MKNFLKIAAILIGATLIAGCDPEVGGEAVCEGPPVMCDVRGEIRVPFSMNGFSVSQNFYPSSVVLDFSQSNVGIPANGFVTFAAFDVSGNPISMTSGSFSQINGIGHLNNAPQVQSWLQGISTDISKIEAGLMTPVTEIAGQNTFNLQVLHDNDLVMAAGETWFRSSLCDTGDLMSETSCID